MSLSTGFITVSSFSSQGGLYLPGVGGPLTKATLTHL